MLIILHNIFMFFGLVGFGFHTAHHFGKIHLTTKALALIFVVHLILLTLSFFRIFASLP